MAPNYSDVDGDELFSKSPQIIRCKLGEKDNSVENMRDQVNNDVKVDKKTKAKTVPSNITCHSSSTTYS